MDQRPKPLTTPGKTTFFRPEDFLEAICVGKMSHVLERIADRANELLQTNLKNEVDDNLRSNGKAE